MFILQFLFFSLSLYAADVSETAAQFDQGVKAYEQKQYVTANKLFDAIKEKKDPVYSPRAAYYQGLNYMAADQLERAQAAFEWVLDNSTGDPELDKSADAQIDNIARLKELKKVASQKFFINATAGLSYDSNILLKPDNDSAASTVYDEAGLRWNLTGDASYRPRYTEKDELSVKFAANNTQSFSTDFVQADPRTYTFSVPYARKGVFKDKGYKLGFTPAYEVLYMDFDRSGQMTNINRSIGLTTDVMLVMKEDWISSTSLEIRKDDSLIPGVESGSDDDSDAIKFNFKKTEILLIDQAKKKAIVASAGFTLNAARGKEKKFLRPDIMAIYTAPIKKVENMTWLTGITYYYQVFQDGEAGRRDTNLTYLFGLNRMINPQWSWSSIGTYTVNNSNDVDSDYSKYLLMASVTYSWVK